MDHITIILRAFDVYCRTGEAVLFGESIGYIEHALGNAIRNTRALTGHPLFMLMALQGDPSKIIPFLNAVTQRGAKDPQEKRP